MCSRWEEIYCILDMSFPQSSLPFYFIAIATIPTGTTDGSYNNFCAVLTNYQLSLGNMKKVLAIINMHLYAPDYWNREGLKGVLRMLWWLDLLSCWFVGLLPCWFVVFWLKWTLIDVDNFFINWELLFAVPLNWLFPTVTRILNGVLPASFGQFPLNSFT